MAIKLDVDSLTLEELEIIEEFSGKDIEDILDMNVLSAKTLRVLAWVIRRRTEKELTLDDCKKMTLGEMSEFLNGDADPKDVTV